MSLYRRQVENLLDEWLDEPRQGTNIINCLVQYLCEDPRWVAGCISSVDAECLIRLSNLVQRSKE